MILIYKSCSIYSILTWCCKALSICIETKSNHTHYSSTGQPTQVTNSSLIEVTVLRTQLHQMKWLTVKGLLSACHLHCYMSHSFSGFITLVRRWKRKTQNFSDSWVCADPRVGSIHLVTATLNIQHTSPATLHTTATFNIYPFDYACQVSPYHLNTANEINPPHVSQNMYL